jgi:ferric-dicitrate binding protein FerR (iron transport regulator)
LSIGAGSQQQGFSNRNVDRVMHRKASYSAALTRRLVLQALAGSALAASACPVRAATTLGKVEDLRGHLARLQGQGNEALKIGAAIAENDRVATAAASFADLLLGSDTHVLLGPDTEIVVDSFIASQGGTIELTSGQMVFDRQEGLPAINATVRTVFGMIGVRGTRFFVGPSQGVFAVYVDHGEVNVTNAGVTRTVGKGQGVEFPALKLGSRGLLRGNRFREAASKVVPTEPAAWDADRAAAAFSAYARPE